MQSCRFHLTHYLASGCSVDSIKRGGSRSLLAEDFEHLEEPCVSVQSCDSVMSQVIVWDLISVLSPHLCPCGRAVLDCLADGLGLREIGRRLKLSHTMVRKYRAKIKSLLVRLERPRLLGEQLHQARRVAVLDQANGVRRADRARSENGAYWSGGLGLRNHINGAPKPPIITAGAFPPWKCNGFLKPSENLTRAAKRS